MPRDAEAQAAIDEVTGQAAASVTGDSDVKIDWDDPASVAKARGDEAKVGETDDKGQAAKADDKAGKAAKADDKVVKDEKGHVIPKHRFDEVNERRKKAEGKLARMEAEERVRKEQAEREQARKEAENLDAARSARAIRIEELTDQIVELTAENKLDEAKRANRELKKLEREEMREEMEAGRVEDTEITIEQVRLDKVIDKLEADYPEFDPDEKNEQYNDELVQATIALRTGYEVNDGMSPSAAMLKAAKVIMGTRAKGKPGSDDANAAAIKRGLKAAEKQGADLDDVGTDSDSAGLKADLPDPTKLTMEEFEALPESKKARMRGDDRV